MVWNKLLLLLYSSFLVSWECAFLKVLDLISPSKSKQTIAVWGKVHEVSFSAAQSFQVHTTCLSKEIYICFGHFFDVTPTFVLKIKVDVCLW